MKAQVQRTITRMEGILRCQQALLLEEAEVALIVKISCCGIPPSPQPSAIFALTCATSAPFPVMR